MTDNYKVGYSVDALDDLREIYAYIADELLVSETAEPWHSMKMHQLPVDSFMVYYLINDEERSVTVARIFYGGRDIEGIINSNN